MKSEILPNNLSDGGCAVTGLHPERGVCIDGEWYSTPVTINAGKIAGWEQGDKPLFQAIGEFAETVTPATTEVLLIGISTPPTFELIQRVADLGVPAECSLIDSAVRTYNVLISEGRRVTALFIP